MKGWINDLLRTAWGFLFWNVRKGWYRLRGARGRCPCQHPSDSGAAHVTGCEAVIGWAKPARFRRICPLLERGAVGRWCCSVNAKDVRPFWGRAAATGLAVVAGADLAGTLALFGLLRARGYALGFQQVVWLPTLRVAFPRAQSELFLRQARADFEAGRISETIVALQVAWRSDPTDYATGLLLAHFIQGADLRGAAQIYTRLRAEHPDKRAEVTRAWFYTLLTHGDFADVAKLAREELATQPGEAVWLNALVFACRQQRDAATLETLATAPGNLPAAWREVAALEAAALRGIGPDEALHARLRAWPPADAPGYAWFYRIDRLLAGGWTADALEGLVAARGHLPDRDIAPLLWAAYAAAGDNPTRSRELKKFLATRPRLNDAEVTLLCAHLIRFPLPEALTALAEAWRRDAGPPDAARLPLALAMYCAAAAGRDDIIQGEIAEWIRMAAGGRLPDTLNSFAEILRTPGQDRLISRLLPTLPTMSLDVVYALIYNNLKPIKPI